MPNKLMKNPSMNGLTKREYFAAAAMQGIMSNSNDHYIAQPRDVIAKVSVAIADALLEELEK